MIGAYITGAHAACPWSASGRFLQVMANQCASPVRHKQMVKSNAKKVHARMKLRRWIARQTEFTLSLSCGSFLLRSE